jgi:HEXXH motif-containing protein
MKAVTEHALDPCPADDCVFEHMVGQNALRMDRHTRRGCGGAGDEVSDARLEALGSAITLLPAEERLRVAESPLFSHWSSSVGRDPAADCILQLGRLILAPHLENKSLPVDGIFVPVSENATVKLPGHGAIRVPGRHAGQVTRITVSGDSLIVGHPGTAVSEVPLLLGQRSGELAGKSGIEIDASDPWIAGHLEAMNGAQRVGPYPKRDISPVLRASGELRTTISQAMALLADSWPEAYAEVLRYTKLIVPFQSKYLQGWSTPLFQGAAFIQAVPGDVAFTLERIVHESAHQRLFAIQRIARIHNDPPDKLLQSALRKDQRPTIGIYHAAFVCGRLAETFTRALSCWPDKKLAERRSRMTAAYLDMSMTLHRLADLTEIGEAMLTALDERVRSVA